MSKSEKELAFLQDLFIAPDWGERFAALIDEHVKLPEKGRALYLNAGTGGHAIAMQDRAKPELKFLCLDESKESIELARAKAITTKTPIEFQQCSLESLNLPDEEFDLVVADGSRVPPEPLPSMISDLVRVARPGASVAFSLSTAGSFGEFFSICWEALHNSGFVDYESVVEHLITELPTVSDVEEMATQEGLENVTSWTEPEEFVFESGEAFINSPLVADFLMKNWLTSIPDEAVERVTQEVARLIDEERHNTQFSLTVKATLVTGRKVELPLAG